MATSYLVKYHGLHGMLERRFMNESSAHEFILSRSQRDKYDGYNGKFHLYELDKYGDIEGFSVFHSKDFWIEK